MTNQRWIPSFQLTPKSQYNRPIYSIHELKPKNRNWYDSHQYFSSYANNLEHYWSKLNEIRNVLLHIDKNETQNTTTYKKEEQKQTKTDIKYNKLLVLGVFDELNDDFLVGLNLEHLHNKAHKRGGFAVAAVSAAEVVELHGLVDQRLRREAEALLLPVSILIYFGSQNLLHQILGVCAPYALREGVCPIRHERVKDGNWRDWPKTLNPNAKTLYNNATTLWEFYLHKS